MYFSSDKGAAKAEEAGTERSETLVFFYRCVIIILKSRRRGEDFVYASGIAPGRGGS